MGKKMTMEQRIEAFYRQSGGPHNPQIQKLLQKHLLYGKDHGMPGYKESFEDAILDVVVNDPSLLLLFERFQRWRSGRKDISTSSRCGVCQREACQLEEKLQRLETEVRELRASVEQLIERVRI
ncbi:MAG: hypothetical protein IMX06_04020 [Kyrpidia tusciae]|nr:hypothetical protein [Kyrpidia tusciae]MBE3552017.1 hypothetical protein [Kyrpidia tusciae]